MKKYQIPVWLYIIPIFLLTGFKKNTGPLNFSSKIKADIVSNTGSVAELPKVSIADVIAVKGEKGQKPVNVMVCLSKPSTEPVTIAYNTKNGSALAGADYIATEGKIKFAPGETMKRISVLIIGEVAADTEEDAPVVERISFSILLTSIENAMILHGTSIITLIKNIFRPQGNQSVYDVEFKYRGYTSLAGEDIGDCPIRSNGEVILTGLLYGHETVGSSDDIDYTGTLQLEIDMDICSVKTEEQAGGGYPRCGLTVYGSGPVKVNLKIHFGGRGGYITTEDEMGAFMKAVVGSCDQRQIGEELTLVPNGTIASVFNGLDLSMLTNRTLQAGQFQQIDGRNTIFLHVRKIR